MNIWNIFINNYILYLLIFIKNNNNLLIISNNLNINQSNHFKFQIFII